jgi:hypothetical protein
MRPLRDGETVVIRCESCEPEVAVVVCKKERCSECFNQVYRLHTETSMMVDCCASILHPLN